MNMNDEILQDFLVEAGELFDQLGEQIIALEQRPEDSDLLNAIFRAFHTIKGGAGFLKATPMVEICHHAEDVFNVLRQGECIADANIIDVILQVIDVVGDMFDQLRAGEELGGVDTELLARLAVLAANESAATDSGNSPVITAAESSPNESSMDDEFEAMLQAAQRPATEKEKPAAAKDNDLITDDEFEDLLDQIHGVGQHSSTTADSPTKKQHTTNTDLITDDEFDAVLDQMYGKNGGPSSASVNIDVEPAGKNNADTSAPEENRPQAEVVSVAAEKNKTGTSKIKKKTPGTSVESSVRVDTSRLDDIMNLVGELVLVKNRLSTLKQIVDQSKVIDAISNLELVTSDLQASVMKTRMQPIKKIFNRFPRVVRDLARQLNKDIDLKLIGEETDLDKNLVEALVDPLIHLVRNAVDHGIESPQERFENNKPRQGTVTLRAAQEGDQILLTISDDGKGMNPEVLRSIAVEKDLMSAEAAHNLTEIEAYNLIFLPGFSTKKEISDVSGRGVGMDVVKTRITELNGTLEINSELGQGSMITIRLPLTLAILPTLMVNLADYQFALPLSNVVEAFNMNPQHINIVDGQEVIRVRDKPLPLYYLYKWLIHDNPFTGPKLSHKVIIVQMGSQRFCLVVDHLIGQEEVVIKPLGRMISATPGFSGAAITGDGCIALVLDMPGLIKQYASAY